MVDITAIFLAAGRGVRMGARGRITPKGLLSIGTRTFMEDAVATLRAHEVAAIRIVTGHLADQYRELVDTRLPGIELRHNPAFSEKGSLHSLLVGLEGQDGPCLVLESDLIFEPRAIETTLAARDMSALLVSGATGAGDEVYVWAQEREPGPCLRDMSKQRTQWDEAPRGELVGVTYLTGAAVAHLKAIGPQMVAANAMADYESGMVALGRSHPITLPKIEDLAWAEVDNEEMLARAAEHVYPRIAAARSAHPRMDG
ncbi:phosphocholine cytidylyltransferase family protein [Stappia sp.]|uniref:phosphocholine cytidylyltransferase family protein n=1 Tax=Stappia sp. TaxID=1870903 RepID=UPI0032D97A7C